MNLLETVEALCQIVQTQSQIISRQALLISEYDSIESSELTRINASIAEVERMYSDLMDEE